MTPTPLSFHLFVHTDVGIYAAGALKHQTTAKVTDTMLDVQTSVSAGVAIFAPRAPSVHVQLSGQWPRSIKKTLAMTKAETKAPAFDAGVWSTLVPAPAPQRLSHSNFDANYLNCDLRIDAPENEPIYWSNERFKAMWLEVAESIRAATANKDLSLRFVSVTTTGQRRELRITQNTRQRTAALEAFVDTKLVKRNPTDIETYLEVYELVTFLRGYTSVHGDEVRDEAANFAQQCRDSRSFTQRLFRGAGRRGGAGAFFFTPVAGHDDLIVSWTKSRVCEPTAENRALLEKLRTLQSVLKFDIEIPPDSE